MKKCVRIGIKNCSLNDSHKRFEISFDKVKLEASLELIIIKVYHIVKLKRKNAI